MIKVIYEGDVIVNLGDELKPSQTKNKPNVTWEADNGAFYMLMKIDQDAPSRVDHSWGQVRHWLVIKMSYNFS